MQSGVAESRGCEALREKLKANFKLDNEMRLNMNRKAIGIVFIVVGIALVVWGYNIYDSAGSQVSRALSGEAPVEAWAGMVGGAICIVFGIFKVK